MELLKLQELAAEETASRPEIELRTCMAAGCVSSNAQAVLDGLDQSIRQAGLEGRVKACGVGCLRLCSRGPLVHVAHASNNGGKSADVMYEYVKASDATAVVTALKSASPAASVATCDLAMPFFTRQSSLVLANSGVIEPERIESSLAKGAYQALFHAIHEMTPAEVVDQITASGLRGRGGAGYPTGVKWATVAKGKGDRRYVVCNADEGDPGAFMNRSELESDPHRILEGMALAGLAIGATQGYIYVRGEYPLAIRRLQLAIRQATKLGLLGDKIFDSAFNFRIDLRIGAGAFVCGEETALVASIEGKRGTPRPRPPYPAQSGLWGAPTLINNVETFANIVPILRDGPQEYRKLGTAATPGTKVFALSGKVVNTGLVEVPIGSTLRVIVEEIGGGVPGGGAIKAVQTGGPSGGCIPASLLDTPVDYDTLAKLGSIMGSGGMIVVDSQQNMVDMARFFMEFCRDESCGKCIPCRAGTVQMHMLLNKIIERKAGQADLAMLESLCGLVGQTSLCGLGQTAPNPVMSTLRYFRDEYTSLLQA